MFSWGQKQLQSPFLAFMKHIFLQFSPFLYLFISQTVIDRLISVELTVCCSSRCCDLILTLSCFSVSGEDLLAWRSFCTSRDLRLLRPQTRTCAGEPGPGDLGTWGPGALQPPPPPGGACVLGVSRPLDNLIRPVSLEAGGFCMRRKLWAQAAINSQLAPRGQQRPRGPGGGVGGRVGALQPQLDWPWVMSCSSVWADTQTGCLCIMYQWINVSMNQWINVSMYQCIKGYKCIMDMIFIHMI